MAPPDLVLLCGLLCDRTVWQRQAEALSANARVHVHDFRGFDRIEAMAGQVLETAPERFALAGHSMGARVALEVVRRAGDRVERLALLDTVVHGIREGERDQRLRLVELARRCGMRALAQAWLPPMVHPARADLDAMPELVAMVERMSPDIFAGQVEALLRRPDAARVLEAIDCPTLVAAGSDDLWSPPEQHRGIAARIRGARLRLFPGAGHMAPWETPEAVTAALVEWLDWPAG